MEQHINTYQGMNKDTAYDSLAATFYIDALDVRITTTTGDSLGGFTNIRGNELAVTLPATGTFNGSNWTALNPAVIGYATIRTKIILFVADNSSTKGWIYNLEYNPADKSITAFGVIYYNPILNFKKEWPIEALGRYEAECTQRVYWTDYNNFFRSINVVDPNLVDLPVGLVDIFPDVKFTQPLFTTIAGGGALDTGVYQISYRLITQDGKETLISPPSNLIHVVSDTESGGNSNIYNGNSTVVNSGKAISITLDTSDYWDFYKIEFIAIYKSSSTATTSVVSVEQAIIANQSTMTFIYTGGETSIFDLELLDFLSRNYAFKTPKTITQKDNSLLIANIKESIVSLQDLLPAGETFDSKTRRYKYNGGSPIPPFTPGTSTNDLNNAFNTAYNSDAHWNQSWQTNSQYRYQADGLRLGGEGPNITYNFHLEEFTLDETAPLVGNTVGTVFVTDTPDSAPHDLNDGYGPYANTTFPNHASPFISGLLRGYKRGETYRFGIVFYTIKGEATFVEYIGDIKFPDISEIDSVVNESGYKFWPISKKKDAPSEDTVGYAMGIEFQIDFSTCPGLLNNITGYQIVRVKRDNIDKRRLTQGLLRGFYYNPILEPHFTGTGGFDLRVNENNNVLHLYPYYPAASEPNASFATLEDSSTTSYVPKYEDYLILGSYLGFYSPEVSFDKNSVADLMLNLGSNPCLLITGAYTNRLQYASPTYDFSSVDLGDNCKDIRNQYYDTYPVNFNSIENIKRWQHNAKFKMEDNADYQTKVTTMFSGYYMRNYWCMDNYFDASDPQVNPNRPQQGAGVSEVPEFFKGGASVIGKVEKITNDFFTNAPITSSTEDYFKAPNNVFPVNRTSLSPTGSYNGYFPIAECILPKIEVYGGYTQDSLESNQFIPASPIIDPANTNPKVFGGDVFINMFIVQTGLVEFNTAFYGPNKYHKDNTRTEIVALESDLNLDLANGATLRTSVKYKFDTLTETAFRQETNNFEAPFAEVLNMYSYNTVYSRQNDDLAFYIQPANIQNCGANDIRAYLSNVKINEEAIDSWTKFGVNNYYDIDDYGPINKVINWKDTVYFVQDKGIGAYTINRAAVTTTADGVPTQLGTGLGFGKHIYYSKVHGAIHQWAVETTEAGIYFFDAFHRKIFMMQAQSGQTANSAISEIKGMHSFLQSLPTEVFTRKENGGDNPILGKGVHLGKDIINDEVLFTFMSKAPSSLLLTNILYTVGTIVYDSNANNYYYVTTTFTSGNTRPQALIDLLNNSLPATAKQVYNSETLVFDELAQQFSSRYSMAPTVWIQNGDIILTPNPLSQNKLYTNAIGDWGVFYDIQEPCELTLVVNPQADVNKILRTMEFNSIVRDNNKIIDRGQTITAFRVSTQYQDTNVVPFSPARFKRKFDKWRLKIPRDQNSANQQGRLRSTYFVVTLYFDNSQNKELIMNRLMSYFDYQVF
jgi:hypothetical protein